MAQSRGESASGTAGGQFSAVDQGVQEQRAVLLRILDYQNAAPGLQAAKRRMRDALALAPGLTALDVGCGTGDDTREMAERVAPAGHVTGIDSSSFMVEEARSRVAGTALPLTFAQGDAERLDFADNTFDLCRCERVLQHVADPGQAISEMVRVTKPGGRVVVCDTDWAKVVASDPITQALFEFNAHSIRNPKIGRNLGQLFRTCGLREISVWPCSYDTFGAEFTVEYTQMLQPLAAAAQAAGALSEADAAAWPGTIVGDGRDGIAFLCLPCFVAVGTKP